MRVNINKTTQGEVQLGGVNYIGHIRIPCTFWNTIISVTSSSRFTGVSARCSAETLHAHENACLWANS